MDNGKRDVLDKHIRSKTMAKKTKYVIWIGFINYLGSIQHKADIAIFYSKCRAKEYLEHCLTTVDNGVTTYGMDER